MIKWHERVPEIGAYNHKIGISPSGVRLSDNLSPLTNFFLNVFINSIDTKNLIVAFPDILLKPIPLIAYLYTYITNKDVLIFTQGNSQKIDSDPIITHNRNYHLLYYGNRGKMQHKPILFEGDYVFYHNPIGILHDKMVEANIYLPRVNRRDLRKKYIERETKNFFNTDRSRIFLSYDDKFIDFIDDYLIDDDIYNNINMAVNPKLIIVENIDRFIHSDYNAKLFNKWISSMPEDMRMILHFSNPQSKYIDLIKKENNSLVIPMLKNNLEMMGRSLLYFSKYKYFGEWEIINRYNIDNFIFYKDQTPIKIAEPPLKAGNIDQNLLASKSFINRINEVTLINKELFIMIRKLLNEIPNLIINPSKYKILWSDDLFNWRYYTIPELLDIFKIKIKEEDFKNRINLKELISEVFCLYLELKECKRPNEDLTFSRIAKDYEIIKMARNLTSTNSDDKIIIATQSSFERNVLKREIENLNIGNRLEIKSIDQISKSNFRRQNTILLLSGPLRLKHLSQLLLPYKEIIYLCYEGLNCNLINQQVDASYSISSQKDLISLNYINEIYDFFGIKKSDIFKGFKSFDSTRKDAENCSEQIIRNEISQRGYLINIKKILKTMPQYSSYREYEDESTKIENNILKTEEKSMTCPNENAEIIYLAHVKGVSKELITKKFLPADKTYLYLENEDGEILEGTPRVIEPHYFIVILDDDVRKSFLELIIDVFGLEDSIDKRFIELWRDHLFRFIEINDLSYSDFYNIYKGVGGKRGYQTVLSWAKGHVLGPLDPIDLYNIGKILNDEDIIGNFNIMYGEIQELRELHRNTGRRLKIIIKEILSGGLDPDRLGFEEYSFYEKVKDGIFEVLNISRI